MLGSGYVPCGCWRSRLTSVGWPAAGGTGAAAMGVRQARQGPSTQAAAPGCCRWRCCRRRGPGGPGDPLACIGQRGLQLERQRALRQVALIVAAGPPPRVPRALRQLGRLHQWRLCHWRGIALSRRGRHACRRGALRRCALLPRLGPACGGRLAALKQSSVHVRAPGFDACTAGGAVSGDAQAAARLRLPPWPGGVAPLLRSRKKQAMGLAAAGLPPARLPSLSGAAAAACRLQAEPATAALAMPNIATAVC